MYNQPFYIPNYYMIRPIPNSTITKNNLLIKHLENIFSGIKSFNWNGLINNTSKALGIINQTIPLVKQVRPMVGNMKSMIKLASAFKDETDIKPHQQNNNIIEKEIINTNNNSTESPIFFIN